MEFTYCHLVYARVLSLASRQRMKYFLTSTYLGSTFSIVSFRINKKFVCVVISSYTSAFAFYPLHPARENVVSSTSIFFSAVLVILVILPHTYILNKAVTWYKMKISIQYKEYYKTKKKNMNHPFFIK